MYAIARSGGKQFKIQPDGVIRVPSLGSNVGEKVKLEEILLVADGDKIQIGTPLVDGAYAEAVVVRHGKDKKIKIIKYKRRKDYRRTLGHRQSFTELEIGKIVLGAAEARKAEKAKKQDKAEQAPAPDKQAPAAEKTGDMDKAVKAKAPAAKKAADADKPVKAKPAATKKAVDADKAAKAKKTAVAKKAAPEAEKAGDADKGAKVKKPAVAKKAVDADKDAKAKKPAVAKKAAPEAKKAGDADKGAKAKKPAAKKAEKAGEPGDADKA